MFESAEIGHKLDKHTYNETVPELRAKLIEAQVSLVQAAKFPVIILVGGVDGSGRSETINLLSEWMDPRHIQVHGLGAPSDEEKRRPYMWRYWRVLPPKGKIGVFFGSWYTDVIEQRVSGNLDAAQLEQHIQRIVQFEHMLTAERALVIKFWFHVSQKVQQKRLKAFKKDPKLRWRVTDQDWTRVKQYDQYCVVSEHILRETSTAEAPWIVVEGTDPKYRNLTVGKVLLEAMHSRLSHPFKEKRSTAPPLLPPIDNRHILSTLAMDQTLPKPEYKEALENYQGQLNLLVRKPEFARHGLVVVFEGWDASGKGGSIRRMAAAMDARWYTVIPIGAPTEEELAQPYLWRFWRRIPPKGRVTMFDRSWYGRVLVERVEGLCSESAWMRAYNEINHFEEQLVEHGIVLVKFWLHISKEEQLKRFKEREQISFKQFKITDEDWRNREKWEDYETAICDMVERTSTTEAPWTLVEANDKRFARIKILKTCCERIEATLVE
jgi:polyphosphate:AMP phosphotransferase